MCSLRSDHGQTPDEIFALRKLFKKENHTDASLKPIVLQCKDRIEMDAKREAEVLAKLPNIKRFGYTYYQEQNYGLMMAIDDNELDIAEKLIKKGGHNVNCQIQAGGYNGAKYMDTPTPLSYAVDVGTPQMVKLLLSLGAKKDDIAIGLAERQKKESNSEMWNALNGVQPKRPDMLSQFELSNQSTSSSPAFESSLKAAAGSDHAGYKYKR